MWKVLPVLGFGFVYIVIDDVTGFDATLKTAPPFLEFIHDASVVALGAALWNFSGAVMERLRKPSL